MCVLLMHLFALGLFSMYSLRVPCGAFRSFTPSLSSSTISYLPTYPASYSVCICLSLARSLTCLLSVGWVQLSLRPAWECGQDTGCHSTEENWLSVSLQQSNANSSSAWHGVLRPPPLLQAGILSSLRECWSVSCMCSCHAVSGKPVLLKSSITCHS